MSMESGKGREYQYDADECLLWVSDYDAMQKLVYRRVYGLNWNPIPKIIRESTNSKGISIEDLTEPEH